MTAQAAELGPERTPAKGGAQFQGSVANCSQSKLADGAEQRGFAAPWILDAIRPCFPMKMEAAFNRRMRANRMSGGVGGCRGAIPGIRPDPIFNCIVLAKQAEDFRSRVSIRLPDFINRRRILQRRNITRIATQVNRTNDASHDFR